MLGRTPFRRGAFFGWALWNADKARIASEQEFSGTVKAQVLVRDTSKHPITGPIVGILPKSVLACCWWWRLYWSGIDGFSKSV